MASGYYRTGGVLGSHMEYQGVLRINKSHEIMTASYTNSAAIPSSAYIDIQMGMWGYFHGLLLGRVNRINYEQIIVEIQDMNTGCVTEYSESFLRQCEFTYKPKEKEKSIMKFKVGDRVAWEGKIGIVRGFNLPYLSVAVEFEGNFSGHSCDGLIPSQRGYYLGEEYLKLIKEEVTMDYAKVGGNALSRLAKSLFNGRVKKFIEVGFLTKDLDVTEKFTRSAMAIVMEDLLSQKKDDVAAVELTVSEVGRRLEAQADEEIQEAKDEKNCCQ